MVYGCTTVTHPHTHTLHRYKRESEARVPLFGERHPIEGPDALRAVLCGACRARHYIVDYGSKGFVVVHPAKPERDTSDRSRLLTV